MGRQRPPRDIQVDESMQAFVRALRDLHARSGMSIRETHMATAIPLATLYAAAGGKRLPGADVLASVVRAWGDDPAPWLRRRQRVEADRAGRKSPGDDSEQSVAPAGQAQGALADELRSLHQKSGGPSLRALAATSGLTASSVSRAMSGISLPTWETTAKLAEALGATGDELGVLKGVWERAQATRALTGPAGLRGTVLKELFGSAASCAFPGCTESLVRWHRGEATVTGELVHIRTLGQGSIRHDAEFKDDPSGPSNMLILCPAHHRLIDSDPSYTAEEIEMWKARQLARSGQTIAPHTPADRDIQVEQSLSIPTETRLTLELIAGADTGNGQLQACDLDRDQIADAGRAGGHIGVRVSNTADDPVTLISVGVEFDLGLGEKQHPFYRFPYAPPTGAGVRWQAFEDLAPHSHGHWFALLESFVLGLRTLREQTGVLPRRIRPYAELGPHSTASAQWIPAEPVLRALAAFVLPDQPGAELLDQFQSDSHAAALNGR
ncbi:helix-turn-helix domain-containing protein [Streptomyces sp. NPDC059874]|uniref:helix-turn-helix domain-containing protein n=1 Tax=Streptomyces sp. NPDC059874 TaxID=3346983 RepID=UPI00364AFD62